MESSLNSVFSIIKDLFDLAVEFFGQIADVAVLLGKISIQIPSYLSIFIPGDVCLILVLGISVVVIYKIAGRS